MKPALNAEQAMNSTWHLSLRHATSDDLALFDH